MAQVTFHSPTHALLAAEIITAGVKAKELKIVDYGCGEGELLNYLPLAKLKEYEGFETNKACLPVAKKNWRKYVQVHFNDIDRDNLPSLGRAKSLDAIFLIGVVQYLPQVDLIHVLKEAVRVLKPGGKILISCTTDHSVYKWLNIYRLFLPHYAVNRQKLLQELKSHKLKLDRAYERGLFLTPFFSNIFIFFFDALDKVIFRTKGELGPIGRKVRQWWAPIIEHEFKWPIDFGYTLFIVASK